MPRIDPHTQTETRIQEYGVPLGWEPQRPRLHVLPPLLVTWLVAGNRLRGRAGDRRADPAFDLASDSRAIHVDSFWWALLCALVVSAAGVVLQVILGANDEETYTLRVISRIAKRRGHCVRTDVPGMLFLEIDGLALPVLQPAMRDGNAPALAR